MTNNKLTKIKSKDMYYETLTYFFPNMNNMIISVGILKEFAFIKMIISNKKYFYKYDKFSYYYDKESIHINIDKNFFSAHCITLDINKDISIKGKLNFYDVFNYKLKELKKLKVVKIESMTRGILSIDNFEVNLNNINMTLSHYKNKKYLNHSFYFGVSNNTLFVNKVDKNVLINIITDKFKYNFKLKNINILNKIKYSDKKYSLTITYGNLFKDNDTNLLTAIVLLNLSYKNKIIVNESMKILGICYD